MSTIRYRDDIDLIPELHAAVAGKVKRFATILLLVVATFFAAFIGWAYFATLDEVTRGDGQVIPSRSVQVIQNLEGGLVADILVREGDVVDNGQVLLRIDNRLAESDYLEKRSQFLNLRAEEARLEAEANGTEPDFPEEVRKDAPSAVRDQLSLYQTNQKRIETSIAIYLQQLNQREEEVRELKARVGMLSRSYNLVREELDITQPLLSQGAVSRVDVLQLERQANDLRTQIESTRLGIPRAEAAQEEARRRIEEVELNAQSEAKSQLAEVRARLAALTEVIAAGRDRVQRSEVRAPLKGIVKDLKVKTIGGVIRPGEDLVELVPLDDTLLIEARIRPHDVAFLRPGQNAKVKITAYDFAIFGGLDATVEVISADTLQSETDPREQFYVIRLRTDRNYLGTEENPLPIIPGMTAQVDILTGQKTVLDYLMKPILRARYNALRER